MSLVKATLSFCHVSNHTFYVNDWYSLLFAHDKVLLIEMSVPGSVDVGLKPGIVPVVSLYAVTTLVIFSCILPNFIVCQSAVVVWV